MLNFLIQHNSSDVVDLAECLMSYWRTTGENAPVKCPLDRTPVSYMVPNFALRDQCAHVNRSDAAAVPSAADVANWDSQLTAYNQRFSNLPRGIGQELREDIAIYRNLPINSMQKWLINGLIVLVVLYILMPVDLIPDTVGLAGYVDDAFALIGIAIILLAMLNSLRSSMIRNAAQH